MLLYLIEIPRIFVIVNDKYALTLRHLYPDYIKKKKHVSDFALSSLTSSKNKPSMQSLLNNVIVEFIKKDELNFTGFRDITPRKKSTTQEIFAFIGFLNLDNHIFLGFITDHQFAAFSSTDESIYQITGVEFFCLNSDQYDYLFESHLRSSNDSVHFYRQEKIYNNKNYEVPIKSVEKLLSSGSFYYSTDFDTATNIQKRICQKNENCFSPIDDDDEYFKSFKWNFFMNSELIKLKNRLSECEQIQFYRSGFLISVIRGYIKSVETKIEKYGNVYLTLISKQSCKKCGPLFGNFGSDDDGNVSNFTETEIIIQNNLFCFSYVILKGNVPLHWELISKPRKKKFILHSFKRKIIFDRSFEASQHSFTNHINILLNQFGNIHILNTLSTSKKNIVGDVKSDFNNELNEAFINHLNFYNKRYGSSKNEVYSFKNNKLEKKNLQIYKSNFVSHSDIPISTSFIQKLGYTSLSCNKIIYSLIDSIINYGAMFYNKSKGVYTGKQQGVFRIISFDSLTKANFLSKVISQEVIELAFNEVNVKLSDDLLRCHVNLWKENDDQLKKITLNFVSTKKKNSKLVQSHSNSSINLQIFEKFMYSFFKIRSNEISMLKLLGKYHNQTKIILHDPVHDEIVKNLKKKSNEFSTTKEITVYASTFNINGISYNGDIKNWIYPKKKKFIHDYDLIFIGIQEIIELTAGQMSNLENTSRKFWDQKIKDCLNEPFDQNKYASLWSSSLGGVALFLFIKESNLCNISNIEASFKKTGFGGVSANKGAIALSLNYSTTSFCFVTSHLAAGYSNIEERHNNYKNITKYIRFSKNKQIKDFDVIFWLGDFNYKIDLSLESVKELINEKKYDVLFDFDQLNKQMASGDTFPFYDEMEIDFPPTYKFDNNTNIYDSSEKQRIPAWTDRILNMSRNKLVNQLIYDCDDKTIFSDHRPVYSIFKVSIIFVNEALKKKITDEIRENFKKKFREKNIIFNPINTFEFFFDDENQNKLPAPSSEKKKWWIEDGVPIKVEIPELNNINLNELDYKVINPKLPINPFQTTNEPEFVKKSKVLLL